MPTSKSKIIMNIEIEDHQVHVWQVNLKTLFFYPKELLKTLSPDELDRANQFKFQKDRECFIIRHYQLRFILSKYCNCQSHELMFRYNSYRKPFISTPQFKTIKFSMSYSGDLMMAGICRENDIGIDIEMVREMHESESIAVENFSLQELKYLIGTTDITDAFFKIWTRKEAFVKAMGKGLYYPLKSFCVEANFSGVYEPLIIFDDPKESKLWKTSELNTSTGYIASLAIKSDRFKILYFQL